MDNRNCCWRRFKRQQPQSHTNTRIKWPRRRPRNARASGAAFVAGRSFGAKLAAERRRARVRRARCPPYARTKLVNWCGTVGRLFIWPSPAAGCRPISDFGVNRKRDRRIYCITARRSYYLGVCVDDNCLRRAQCGVMILTLAGRPLARTLGQSRDLLGRPCQWSSGGPLAWPQVTGDSPAAGHRSSGRLGPSFGPRRLAGLRAVLAASLFVRLSELARPPVCLTIVARPSR